MSAELRDVNVIYNREGRVLVSFITQPLGGKASVRRYAPVSEDSLARLGRLGRELMAAPGTPWKCVPFGSGWSLHRAPGA